MRTGPILATDLIDKYRPLGAFGQPVYLSYVQLRATIAQKLGLRHANYFARPDRDPQNKSVHWIAEVPGEAVRWSDLAAEEQTRYAVDLQAMRSDFIRYMSELRQQGGETAGGKGAAAFASLLEQAMLVPDDSHLYFVGDQPVVSFWGFRNVDGQGVDPLAVAPRKVAVAPPASAMPGQAAVAGPAVALAPAGRPWWRWLLWTLALLLLLLLLFGLYRCVSDDPAVTLPPGTLPSDPPLAEKPRDDSILGRTRRFFGLEDEVPGGSVTVPGQVVPGQVVPGEVVPGEVVPGQVVPGESKVEGEATVPPSDATLPGEALKEGAAPEDQKPGEQAAPEPPQPPVPEDAQSPKPDQPKPDQPTQAPKPPNAQDPNAPKPDAAKDQPRDQNQGDKGQPLQIPPDAAGKSGSAGFLGGEWKSDAGLVDQATKQPLQQSYRFDKQGQGEVVIRRADGVECRAGAQARMQGGKLSIDEAGDPTCPDGRKYGRSQTECSRTPSGQTVCQGRNADGTTYRVGIQRPQQP